MNIRPFSLISPRRGIFQIPKTYIFHLRHDVQFHDGRPLTSKDVVFTFQSILDRSVQTAKLGTYDRIESVEGPDPYTVVFRLKEVFAPFLWNLGGGAIGIIPAGSGTDFGRHPIGTGPFAFVHYIQDQEVVLKRNENYFDRKADAGILRFKIIPEAVVAALELRKGSVDIALNVLTPDMDDTVRKDSQSDRGAGRRHQLSVHRLQPDRSASSATCAFARPLLMRLI